MTTNTPQYDREWRAKNGDHIREYKRIYNREWRRKHGFYIEIRSTKKHMFKEKARVQLRRAVKIGVVKKKPCEVCGSLLSQAHHDDYSKPLQVRWFCPLHHTQHHKKTA